MRSPWATPLDRLPPSEPDEGGVGGFIAGAKVLADRFADDKGAEREFDCAHCGDGDALRAGESCAYCGMVR